MNSDFFSLESILKLLGILLLVALGGGALATVVGALVYNVIAPVVYYIFGTEIFIGSISCLLYTSPSPRDSCASRMPSSA